MKKILLFVIAVALLSCKSNPTTKLDNKTEVALKGNWTLTKVEYPGSNVIRVQSFHLADAQCLEGSQWRFVSNNNTGEFALSKSGCPEFSSKITWLVNREGNFVMKILDAGSRARQVKDGYVLRVANITESSFQLVDRMNVGGQMTNITYQFVRN